MIEKYIIEIDQETKKAIATSPSGRQIHYVDASIRWSAFTDETEEEDSNDVGAPRRVVRRCTGEQQMIFDGTLAEGTA